MKVFIVVEYYHHDTGIGVDEGQRILAVFANLDDAEKLMGEEVEGTCRSIQEFEVV